MNRSCELSLPNSRLKKHLQLQEDQHYSPHTEREVKRYFGKEGGVPFSDRGETDVREKKKEKKTLTFSVKKLSHSCEKDTAPCWAVRAALCHSNSDQ